MAGTGHTRLWTPGDSLKPTRKPEAQDGGLWHPPPHIRPRTQGQRPLLTISLEPTNRSPCPQFCRNPRRQSPQPSLCLGPRGQLPAPNCPGAHESGFSSLMPSPPPQVAPTPIPVSPRGRKSSSPPLLRPVPSTLPGPRRPNPGKTENRGADRASSRGEWETFLREEAETDAQIQGNGTARGGEGARGLGFNPFGLGARGRGRGDAESSGGWGAGIQMRGRQRGEGRRLTQTRGWGWGAV